MPAIKQPRAPQRTPSGARAAARLAGHAQQGLCIKSANGPRIHCAISYQFHSDFAARLASRKVQAGTSQDLITQAYGYDSLERLAQIKYIKAQGSAGEQLLEQIDYGYDALGQRTSKTTLNANGTGGAETPMSATFDAANRMSSITLTANNKTYTLAHDANGNLTQKQNAADPTDTTRYSWDASNRLTQISQGNSSGAVLSASFSYDAFGRRIQSTISQSGQTPTTVQYLYEGQQALGEIRNGTLSQRLLTGLSLDETIARIALNSNGQKDAAQSRIYLTDALNSVIAQLSDDTANPGQLQNSYAYSPYGQSQTVGPDATSNPIQYTSRENDNTGLVYYRARYYDAVLKTFLSEDPLGLADGLNLYAYVGGSPVSYVDPTGLMGQGAGGGTKSSPVNKGTGFGCACSGGETQFSLGISGTIGGSPILFPAGFISGGVSIGVTSNGAITVQFQRNVSLGFGLFAGAGIQGGVSYSKGPTTPGWSTSYSGQTDLNFGAGKTVGGSVQFGPEGGGAQGAPGKLGRLGAGVGFQASVGVTETNTYATKPMFCQ